MDVCIHELDVGTCSLCDPASGRRVSRRSSRATSGIATLHFDTGTVEVDCPYNGDFVDEIKAALPGYARRWDGDRKVWVIAGEWWDTAQEIVESYFVLAE